MPAADDLRRVLRRAGRRPRAVLRGFWADSGPPAGANDAGVANQSRLGSARSRSGGSRPFCQQLGPR